MFSCNCVAIFNGSLDSIGSQVTMSKRDRPGSGSPPTKKSKEKSGEVFISYVKCKEVAEEDSIECKHCLKWEH